MLRDLLAVSLLAVVLWGVWQLGQLRDSLAHSTDTPMQRKMDNAERIIMYRFDRNQSPAFHLDGDEVELRLVNHLVLQPGHQFAADKTFDYGLRLRIDGPDGTTLWNRDIYTASRQSKANRAGGYWMLENAFSLDPSVQITDDRIILVTLPRNLPFGSRFYAYLEAPGASHGLIRAYERGSDTSLNLSLTYFSPDPLAEERLVGRLTYLPWDALSNEQRLARLRLVWDRMSALGAVGEDYEVETIYYTGFRAPPAELPPPPATTLIDDRATAFTAWGPGELRLWIHADCPRDLDPAPSVELIHLDAMGVVDGRHVDPCEGATVDTWFPEGPHTVHVRGHDLPLTTIDAWYDDHLEEPSPLPGREFGVPIRPIITRSPRIRLDTGGVPAEYSLVEPEDLDSAIIRIRARLPVPPRSGPEAQTPATIRYTFSDDHGQTLEKGEWVVQPADELDEYEFIVDAADAEREWWNSPVRTARFIAPEGTRRLRLESEGEVVVSVFAYWSGTLEPRQPHHPYDLYMLIGTIWRRIPWDYQHWFLLSPHNAHILQRHGQSVDLHGPIRLEIPGDGRYPWWNRERPSPIPEPATSTSPWVSLAPYTRHEQRTVLARTEPNSPWARYARWRPGDATLTVDDDWGAELTFLAEGDPKSTLGQVITVTIDGQTLEYPIVATRGRVKLPGLDAGTHELSLGPLPKGMIVLIDRPTIEFARGPTEVYRVLTLYRLTKRRMGLRLDKTEPAREYLNALMYRCSEYRPSTLRVDLDRGSPRRRRGVPIDRVTSATRTRTIPGHGAAQPLLFLDRPQAWCEALGRIPVPLGPELAQGRHDIDLRITDGPSVWVRFFRRGLGTELDERAYEWTERRLDLFEPQEAP